MISMNETGTITKKKIKNKVKIQKPKQYRVLLHNNPITPFNVVVEVLREVFNLNERRAYDVMMYCHRNGMSQCFEGTKDQCETKVEQAKEYCKQKAQQFPHMSYDVLEFSVDDLE